MIIGISATLKKAVEAHNHDLHEFIVCLQGSCEIRAARDGYQIETGCTLFIPGGVTHGIVADESSPALLSFTCFDWQSCNEHLHYSLKPLVKRLSNAVSVAENYDESTIRHNLSLAEQLKKELQKKDFYSQTIAGSILTQLLVNHIRDLGLQTNDDITKAEQKISRSIEWITNHLTETIRLEEMARSAHMSRSLYSRTFRAYTGMSLISFIMAARVEKAAQLLAQTEDTITNIALSCGFRNIGHFHKVFKKRYRMTPKRYRQTTRKQGVSRESRNAITIS